MSRLYVTARGKLDYIRCDTLAGRVIPSSQVRMMAAALDFALEVLEGIEKEPALLPEAIPALRKNIEGRILPIRDSML